MCDAPWAFDRRVAHSGTVPEGHTIHRLALQHTRLLGGERLRVSSPQGRFADGAALLDRRTLAGVEAWGKHLFYDFGEDRYLHVHLGLFGRFWPWRTARPVGTRQVRLRLATAARGVDLTGPTACEVLDPVARNAILARLGPDPLRQGSDAAAVWPKLRARRGPVGAVLLDQSVIAGVGNVFRAEALFVCGIHPERPARTLDEDEWSTLWSTLQRMLRAGVRAGRIRTVPSGDPSGDGRLRWVYKQERCARCGGTIRRWDLAGRWAYA
jgi:endonuclease-8